MLVPKADRLKDWEDKAMVELFIGYSKSIAGYRVLLGNNLYLDGLLGALLY